MKHHENMIRETVAWRYVGSFNVNLGAVRAVDGSGSESSSIVSSSSLLLCVLMGGGGGVGSPPGVPGTESEGDDKESE